MAFARAAALRLSLRSGARPVASRPQLWQQVARRGYASGHGHAKASGDALWATVAIGVTVPVCWYLLQYSPGTSSGHGDHDDHHGDSHAHGSEVESEDAEEEAGEADSAKADETPEASESDDESKDSDASDTPDTSDDEASGDSQKDTKQGEATETGDENQQDKPAASKPAGGAGTQSGKQEGLSNTDTKHSTDVTSSPNVANKGEGTPESSKVKGTVDTRRPQA